MSLSIIGVFFALNETFGWLTFFNLGTGQQMGAGDIIITFAPKYATYREPGDAYGKYGYMPSDDLCEQPNQDDITYESYAKLGFNLSIIYNTRSPCNLRFTIDYITEETPVLRPVYDTEYAYDAAGDAAREDALVLAKFNPDFICGMDGGRTYWYYSPASGGDLPASSSGRVNDVFTSLILSGPNVVNSTGKITIIITATMRQSEEGVDWTNYKDAAFPIVVP